MKYNNLVVNSNKDKKRVGRGISAGGGKTAGRGTKGQKSRSGHNKMRATFMGGQKAFMQAVPKLKGFKSIHPKAQIVYTDMLNDLSGKVDNFLLAEKDLIKDPYMKTKIITRGELKSKIELNTQFASKTAIAAIEKAGGKFNKVATPSRQKLDKNAK